MAQHDYNIANQTGFSFRSDLNAVLAAIVTNNSGATAPSPSFPFQMWIDTSTWLLKIRNSSNSAWVTLGDPTIENLGLLLKSGGTMSGAILAAPGTAAAPGVAFSGDPDSGVYSSGANSVSIAAAGTEVFKASPAGVEAVGTGAIKIPAGTTAQRPGTPLIGQIRYNSEALQFEGYNGTEWLPVGGAVADGAITTAKLANSAVTSAKLATNSVTTASILDGVVTPAKRSTAAYAQSGIINAKMTENGGVYTAVPSASVTITSSGRPVLISFVPNPAGGSLEGITYDFAMLLGSANSPKSFRFKRNGSIIAVWHPGGGGGSNFAIFSVSQFFTLDVPSPGSVTYTVDASVANYSSGTSDIQFIGIRLAAAEL